MGEAILLSAMAMVLALALLQAILPMANNFVEKDLALQNLPANWLFILVGAMSTAGILSSLYPAYVISRVMPSEALKKEIKSSGGLQVRKVLVAVQFAVSIMMIASTLVIYQQLDFLRSKDLGFSLSNLLVIDINSDRLRRNFEDVKHEFAAVPEVQSITTSTRVPGEWKDWPIARVKTDGNLQPKEMIYVGVDQDFLNTYQIKLLEGRNFNTGRSDSLKVILTKLAVEQLGLTNPVGQMVEIPAVRWGAGVDELNKPFSVEVIGVAENFYFESFRQQMMPLMFAAPNTSIQRIDYYTLNIKTNNWAETLDKLKAVNLKLDADNPMEYNFLDAKFEAFYKADEKRGQLFVIFSLVIVIIACLGLFALVSYSIESRTKEIGIRKVLGASVQTIITMMSREFLIIVLFAGVFALPAAWYLMKNWLSDFAYRVPLKLEVFALAAVLALTIALVTIFVRTIRAATANPVDSLRSE